MKIVSKYLFVLCFILINSPDISAQNLNDWKAYPSFSTVNSITYSEEGSVYGATLGGIYGIQNNEIVSIINTLDGLYRSDPTSIIYDELNNRLIAGYIDGMIDVITLAEGNIERIEDIQRVSRFNTKRINSFTIYDNNLYVTTGFGVVVYNLENMLVLNSYLKIGDFNIGMEINELDIVDDKIYLASNEGVGVGDLEDNLVESSKWATFTEKNGLPANTVSDIVFFDSKIYASINQNVYEYNDNQWLISSDFSGLTSFFISRNAESSKLAVSSKNRIRVLETDGTVKNYTPDLTSSINELMLRDNLIYAGTTNEGIIEIESESEEQLKYLPSGPYLNFFSGLSTDQSNIIAVSTDAFPGGDPFNIIRGYYIYDGEMWKNFNINTNEKLNDNNFYLAFSAAYTDSSYFIGSWGKGVVKHNKSNDEIRVYNALNSNLSGWVNGTNYVVISGLASDSENNMWMISSDSDFPLNVNLSGSDDWKTFSKEPISGTYFKLFIDSFDQKWISIINSLSSDAGQGLMILDTGDSPEDSDDDTYVKLTDSDGNGNLPDQKINAIVQDKNGEVWIGTDRGIARFIFPELIIEGGPNERRAQWLINEDTTAASRFLLRDVNVSAMAVNGANQKWIGSATEGLWLLNGEGSRIEARYTKENSSLISNTINDISIIRETGEVLISTDQGLVSFLDIPKEPVQEMDKLKVFPNPFDYSKHDQIVIEGLSEATQLKILGVDGLVVNEIETSGGRISWDGRDYNNNELGSGVYFVIAYEDDGKEKGIGKVVIIR